MEENTQLLDKEKKLLKTGVKVNNTEISILEEKMIEAFPDDISIRSLTKAATDFMGIVGQIENLSGAEKKQLVIDVLIRKAEGNELLKSIILDIVPDIIDYLIDVENGDMVFNQRIKNKLRCFVCFIK